MLVSARGQDGARDRVVPTARVAAVCMAATGMPTARVHTTCMGAEETFVRQWRVVHAGGVRATGATCIRCVACGEVANQAS